MYCSLDEVAVFVLREYPVAVPVRPAARDDVLEGGDVPPVARHEADVAETVDPRVEERNPAEGGHRVRTWFSSSDFG